MVAVTQYISANNKFRQDINGLRAWAVVAVVLYHFGVPGFRGGFVGVDIFFVISGFLMTGLIIDGLSGNRSSGFSILRFYLARARRIVPALAVLCAVLLIAGWFLLPAADYSQLSQHVATALGFVSNFKFWREVGYFDVESHNKWLLHTWSLSVEWQFYLLLPLTLVFLWRWWPSRRAMTRWVALGFAASLVASVFLTPILPSMAFYLLPTRAWEMLAGGLVFLLPTPKTCSTAMRRCMELAGFVLILGAVVFTDIGTQWPGWRALIPVLGAVLVLLAARDKSIWTATRPVQWLGNISYSLYLWHWPMVVALVFLDRQFNPVFVGFGVLAALLLGHLSWLWVEQASRQHLARLVGSSSLVRLTALVLVVFIPSVFVYLKNGVPGRIDSHIEQVFAETNNINPRDAECLESPPNKVPECTYGGEKLGAIVVGDSHAATVIRSVEQSMSRPDEHVLDWTYSGCPMLEGFERVDRLGCSQFTSQILEKQKSLGNAPIIIVNRTSAAIYGPNEFGSEHDIGIPRVYFDIKYSSVTPEFLSQFRQQLIDTACQFAKYHPTYLVRPIPELRKDVPRTMGRGLLLGHQVRVSISLDEYHTRHRFVWEAQDAAQAQCGVNILDPLPYLCRDGRCWGDKDGLPLYFDNHHLSERGANLLIPMFKAIF